MMTKLDVLYLPSPDHPTVILTPRQLDVLYLIAQGVEKKAIARQLYLSYDTIRSHARAARKRLGATNDANMVYLAAKAGLLEGMGL